MGEGGSVRLTSGHSCCLDTSGSLNAQLITMDPSRNQPPDGFRASPGPIGSKSYGLRIDNGEHSLVIPLVLNTHLHLGLRGEFLRRMVHLVLLPRSLLRLLASNRRHPA
uniref:Uncharacterized protein n=1 Tax=Plectus sambesii TaxID=2011161 RepID=A0A914UUD6_9BILA